jgi:ABC-type phosphate transport system permease subunit
MNCESKKTLAKKKNQRKKNVKSFFIYLAVVLTLVATVMVARFIHEQSLNNKLSVPHKPKKHIANPGWESTGMS